jgi:hypothetical protein
MVKPPVTNSMLFMLGTLLKCFVRPEADREGLQLLRG